MSTFLCLTIRFLQPYCHARGDGGLPEWPPSPLRAFQALVAAAAGRWNERLRVGAAAPALRWLERQAAPLIVSAAGVPSDVTYRLYVPDNVADKVAKAWSRGGEASIATSRTEKDVRPTRLEGEAVHYLFALADGGCPHLDVLAGAARSITHVGWGVDMVAANAIVFSEQDAAKLAGVRWRPSEGGTEQNLRVPVEGTLDDLARKHAAFLTRLSNDGFRPVPPLSVFRTVTYRRANDPSPRPFAAFSILQPDGSGFRPFDAARRATVVAGMARHALALAANAQRPFGWTDEEIAAIVLGHGLGGGPAKLPPDGHRFAFLPLPSIEPRGSRGEHVGMIRRVLVAGKPGMLEHIAWVRRALSGSELIEEGTGEVKGLLSLIPASDLVVRRYVRASPTWATVTPVVIPGLDDRRASKLERLLRKALVQAGAPPELVDTAELDWRGVGFLPGVEKADRYRRPRNASEAPVRHVRVRWRDLRGEPISVSGPFSAGSGRYRGLGIFAATD